MIGPRPSESLKAELLAAIPNMRAFALSLCGNADHADDLAQETLVRAWDKLHTFEEGTNLKAWLFTILRNAYYSEFRKHRREVADSDGIYASRLASRAEQPGHLELTELLEVLERLPCDQREALILVGAEGFAYEEAAEICGCAVGTIKSRVNRARRRLADTLKLDAADESDDERSETTPVPESRSA